MQVFKKTALLLGLLFLIFCTAGVIFASDLKTAGKKGNLINCDIQNQPCVQPIAGGSVMFDILPRPVKAMEEVTFEVKVTDLELSEPPAIDLSMPGMKMGPNQVKMEMTAFGVYQGTGIIVRCPSGKTVWQAKVHLPGKGSVDFIFDVIY